MTKLKRPIMASVRSAVMIFCLLYNGIVSGRPANDFCNVQYRDSISLDAKSKILYNTVHITNTSRQAVTLQVSVSMPVGWRLLGDEKTSLSLAPGEKKALPMAIIKLPAATAAWEAVIISVSAGNSADTAQYQYFIRASTLIRFRAIVKLNDLTIVDREQESCIPVHISNTGTVDGIYSIRLKCKGLEIDERITLTIPPHADSNFTYCLKVPREAWRNFRKEQLTVEIKDTAKNIYLHTVNISRTGDHLNMHPSRFQLFPVTVEGGVLNMGSVVTYYGAVNGQALLDDGDKVSFAYRSKQFGPLATFQRNTWNVEYDHKKWLFYGGTITDNSFFPVINTGTKITHKWSENGEISISGGLYDDLPPGMANYSSDNLTASLKYGIRRMVVSHIVASNFNQAVHLNNYILDNKLQLVKSRNVSLEASGGAGLEQSTYRGPNSSGTKWGSAFGYLFTYNRNEWSFVSNIRQHSESYPGLFQGFKTQNHTVSRKIGRINMGLFYQSNTTHTNFFRDTIYRADVFDNNVVRYGSRLGWSGKGMGITWESGILSQQGAGKTIGPQYPYSQLSWSYRKKDLRIRISSLNGYTNRNGDTRQDVWITTSSITVNMRHLGCQASYVRAPVIDPKEKEPITGFNQTLNCTPYVMLNIGKHINAQFQYTFSRSIYDQSVQTFIGGDLSFHDDLNGMLVRLYGNVPMQSSSEIIPGLNSRYITLSVSKKFGIPLIPHRKFYDLKVLSYFDENANGKRDDGEPLLQQLSIDINGATLVTDEYGAVEYDNVERGNYAIDLHETANIKGIAPSRGFAQQVSVMKNTVVEIPFKKSKLITGKLKVVFDSLAPMRVRLDDIKITATDTSGQAFVTATDDAGEFFLNLPAGIYSVSLNPKAFDGKIKPVRAAYKIDLVRYGEAMVVFELVQKNREVRLRTFK